MVGHSKWLLFQQVVPSRSIKLLIHVIFVLFCFSGIDGFRGIAGCMIYCVNLCILFAGTIFVGGIDSKLTPRDIEKAFLKFGSIEEVRKPPRKGFAFVCFRETYSARVAVQRGQSIYGHESTVEFSQDSTSSRGRSFGRPAIRTKSAVARRATLIKNRALRRKPSQRFGRKPIRRNRSRSPLVLIRRGQRSPSLIGGSSPRKRRRSSTTASPTKGASRVNTKKAKVSNKKNDAEDERDRSFVDRSFSRSRSGSPSPTHRSRRDSVSSPKRWSSSLSPRASPARSWSYSLSSPSRTMTPEKHLSDSASEKERSPSSNYKRKMPSTPPEPTPPSDASFRSLSPKSRPISKKKRKRKPVVKESVKDKPLSPRRRLSSTSMSDKKRKRLRILQRNKQPSSKVRLMSISVTRPKPLLSLLKRKKKKKRKRLGGRLDAKPPALMDMKVRPPPVRSLLDLTPIRRPPSPKLRALTPPPLLSQRRSISMSPTPSPHRRPIDAYRVSPPSPTIGGYKGGLYYRGQAGYQSFRNDAQSRDSYSLHGERSRTSTVTHLSYTTTQSDAFRSRSPRRRYLYFFRTVFQTVSNFNAVKLAKYSELDNMTDSSWSNVIRLASISLAWRNKTFGQLQIT